LFRKEIEYEKLQRSVPNSEDEVAIKERLEQLDNEIHTLQLV